MNVELVRSMSKMIGEYDKYFTHGGEQ